MKSSQGPGNPTAGGGGGTREWAVVFTVTVPVTGFIPSGVTDPGLTLQVVAWGGTGTKLHVNVTALLNPLMGITVRV